MQYSYFPFDLVLLPIPPLFCSDMALFFTSSHLLNATRILCVKGLLREWRGRRDSWPLVILVSWPFLSSGWPSLPLKNVLPMTEWRSVSVPANGQLLKEWIETSVTSEEMEVQKKSCLEKRHWCRVAPAAARGGMAQGRKDTRINVRVAGPVSVARKSETREEQSHRKAWGEV